MLVQFLFLPSTWSDNGKRAYWKSVTVHGLSFSCANHYMGGLGSNDVDSDGFIPGMRSAFIWEPQPALNGLDQSCKYKNSEILSTSANGHGIDSVGIQWQPAFWGKHVLKMSMKWRIAIHGTQNTSVNLISKRALPQNWPEVGTAQPHYLCKYQSHAQT